MTPDDREIAPQLKWMPNWLECAIVMTVSLGLFVIGSLEAAFSAATQPKIDDAALRSLLSTELVLLILLVPFLRARGWTLRRFGLNFNRSDALTAVALALLILIANYTLWFVVSLFAPAATKSAAESQIVSANLGTAVVIAASFVNALYEELFVAGYFIRFIQDRRAAAFAVNASVILRVSYHLYQGSGAFITIVPFALILGWYFVRTGRLWPLILSHALLDVLSLAVFAD